MAKSIKSEELIKPVLQYKQIKEQIEQLQAQIKKLEEEARQLEDKFYTEYPIKEFAFTHQGKVYIALLKNKVAVHELPILGETIKIED